MLIFTEMDWIRREEATSEGRSHGGGDARGAGRPWRFVSMSAERQNVQVRPQKWWGSGAKRGCRIHRKDNVKNDESAQRSHERPSERRKYE